MNRRRFLGGAGAAVEADYRTPAQFHDLVSDYITRYRRADSSNSGVNARLYNDNPDEPWVYLELSSIRREAAIGCHITARHPNHFKVTSKKELVDAMVAELSRFPEIRIKREI